MIQTLTAKQFRKGAIFPLLLLFMATLTTACSKTRGDVEVELRQWVDAVETAAVERARRDLLGLVSTDYGDDRGNERDDIDKMLRAYFLRQSNIKLLTSIDSIQVVGDGAAKIELTVGMAGQNDGVFGFSADAYRFSLDLQIEDEEWRLVAARWGEVGDELR